MSAPERQRFTLIDGLRGLAALAVMLYHVVAGAEVRGTAEKLVPPAVFAPLDHGYLGVVVFFVISGFVIAWSVRDATVTPRFVANFAFRRALRLDPPYWATIALVIAGNVAAGLAFHRAVDLPSVPKLLSHAVYLQAILGYGHISPPFWTLCFEVQFYLLLITGFGLLAFSPRLPALPGGIPGLVLLIGGAASMFAGERSEAEHAIWVVPYLSVFFSGTMAMWAHEANPFHGLAKGVQWPLGGLIVAMLAYGAVWQEPRIFVGALTTILVIVAGRTGGLQTWLREAPFQYLGRISYSLYLVHVPIGARVVNIGARLAGDSAVGAVLTLIAAIVASLIAADLMYRLVERPSVEFAKRFK